MTMYGSMIMRYVTIVNVIFAALLNVNGEPGTTEHISDIFRGRCWDYKLLKLKSRLQHSSNEADCVGLWTAFSEAFTFQAPCSLSVDHYMEFMNMAKAQTPADKLLFWSGTYDIAHEYAQDSERYITLEDTLIGYLANSLVWCGSSNDPSGMNMSRCPSWQDCPLESSESFWAAASTTFAKSAQGVVTILLDGSREDKPAYSKQSFFAKYELPNLPRDEVSLVTIIITHTLGGPYKETCFNGSIVDLKEDIEMQGFRQECLDDPPAILHLLCTEEPKARECKLAKDYFADSTNSARPFPININYKPDRFSYE